VPEFEMRKENTSTGRPDALEENPMVRVEAGVGDGEPGHLDGKATPFGVKI
jgi:hypothetical protein